MNIEQANAISIEKILEKLELKPIIETTKEATYFSPFKKLQSPGFLVNKKDNTWFDQGLNIGGNAFELVIQIRKTADHSHQPEDALRWFQNTNLDPSRPRPRDLVRNKKSKWRLIREMELENLALTRYLRERRIDVKLAKRYVNEIYVCNKNDRAKMYALGFKNEDGGYEFCNKFVSSCVAPRTVIFVRADLPNPEGVMIFADCIDFLTYLTIKSGKLTHDVIILTSVACVDHAFRYIKNYGYKFVATWMKNSKTGAKALDRIVKLIAWEPGSIHKPMNHIYQGHEDLNAWHMHNLN